MPAAPFVGREEELHALRAAVADQEGKVVLVIGGEGRGKSALLAELNRQLAQEPLYFPLLYQLNDKDMSDAFLGRLMDDLLNIGGLTKGKLILGVPDQAQRWREFLDAATGFGKVPIIGPLFQPVSSIAGLLKQLVRDDKRPMRERFLHFLRGIASRLEGAHRLVLILDPDKYLDESVEADWRTIAQQAPERVTIIFGQRPDDCLAGSPDFLACRGVQCVPREELQYLPRLQSDDLIRTYWESREEWRALAPEAPQELLDLLWQKYQGWALPLTMALEDIPARRKTLPDLLEAARKMPPELERLLRLRFRNAVGVSDDAAKVLRALAILAKPATFGRISDLYKGGIVSEERLERVCADTLVARCLTRVAGGKLEIFHATMTEYILANMGDDTKRKMHRRAAELYEADLKANDHDLDALDRVTVHLWEAKEEQAFLRALDDLGRTRDRLRLYRSLLRDEQRAVEVWRARVHRRVQGAESSLATAAHNLGLALQILGHLTEANEVYAHCVGTKRHLARADPAKEEPGLASLLNGLGNVLGALGHCAEARAVHEEALGIRRRLAQADPAVYEHGLAESLHNMGIALSSLGQLQEARAAHQEATGIHRRLAEAEPAAYEADLAVSLGGLGAAMRGLGELREALGVQNEALGIRRRLMQAEPGAHEPGFAWSLVEVGVVLHDLGQLQQARKAEEQGVGIQRRLAEAEPTAYEPGLAAALSCLSTVLHDLGRPALARGLGAEAVAMAQRLARAEPQAHEGRLALCLANLARAHRALGEVADARTCAAEALAMYRSSVEARPMLRPELAMTLDVVATVHAAQGKADEARAAFEESLSIFTDVARATPTRYLRYLDETARNAQRFLEGTGQPLSSWPTLQRALEVIAECEAANPELAERVRRLREIREGRRDVEHGSVEPP
jgi:tetratricopeptide (TPR) repeat protein